jgi:chemotaxis protein MotB
MSSSVLFDQSNPRNPINRRISLILMTKQAEEAALQSDRPAGQFGGDDPAAGTAADNTASPAAAAAAIEGSVRGG